MMCSNINYISCSQTSGHAEEKFYVWPVSSVGFDIGISYLARGSITTRQCVQYIHDLDTTLTFGVKVN